MSAGLDEFDESETPLLITASKLAALLEVSTRTLWRLRSAGRLPEPVRLGGAVRWRRDDILKWITDGCQRFTDRGQ
jgi:predicted DNA-binding transcriptional regulator AlpA